MGRLYKWLNKSGVLYLNDGRRIGPGENFTAPSSLISSGFMDTVIKMDNEEVVPIPHLVEQELKKEQVLKSTTVSVPYNHFIVEERHGGGWYDVIVQGTGLPINKSALRKAQAEALAEEKNNGNIS